MSQTSKLTASSLLLFHFLPRGQCLGGTLSRMGSGKNVSGLLFCCEFQGLDSRGCVAVAKKSGFLG